MKVFFGVKIASPVLPANTAGVVCDTIGDPYKDTTGPSINILIKAMTMSSIITFLLGYRIHEWLVSILPFMG